MTVATDYCRLVAAPLHIAAISTGATLTVVLWVPPGPSAPRIAGLLLLIAVVQVPITAPGPTRTPHRVIFGNRDHLHHIFGVVLDAAMMLTQTRTLP